MEIVTRVSNIKILQHAHLLMESGLLKTTKYFFLLFPEMLCIIKFSGIFIENFWVVDPEN